MKQLEAMEATIKLALDRNYDNISFDEEGCDYEHFEQMLKEVREDPAKFSEAKLGRWLGFIQGVLVAKGTATVEEMKLLNKGFA